jgi:hypothetical protein
LWQRTLAARVARVAVADDGTVIVSQGGQFVGGENALISFAPDGTERWSLPGAGTVWLAVGADGTVYAVEPGGHPANGLLGPGVLRAIAPDGRTRWTYSGRIAFADPIIGGDGTIYVGGTPLVALHPDGTRAWRFPPVSGGALVPEAIGADGTLFAGGGGAMFALAGPSARTTSRPRSPAGQRKLIAGLSLRPRRFRMFDEPSICPAPGRPCTPRAPFGATLAFTVKRPSVVLVRVRRAGQRTVVAHRSWHTGAGTTWSALWDAIDYRTLAPGRYTLTVRAAAGTKRRTVGPVAFTVVR